ncbi:MAG: hypothetical protein M0Z41_07145 [Peptococcaceae bacterium]|nr:hypothetical protein [Peptococcaceae bacterium]
MKKRTFSDKIPGLRGLPVDKIPGVSKITNEYRCAEVRQLLQGKGLHHLSVLARGDHTVIYSEDDGEKLNRARLTYIRHDSFQLGIANHRGIWEQTPYIGTIAELVGIVTEQFYFVLAEV